MAELREKPLSYIKWLQTQNSAITQEADLFNLYNEYVRDFYGSSRDRSVNRKNLVVELYADLLKEITINYTTTEEKRFLSNVDFTNNKELDTILPFFVKKLRQITQYLVSKRQQLQFTTTRNSIKGSDQGIERVVKDIVIRLLDDTDFVEKYPNSIIPAVSSIISDLNVEVLPLYDEFEHYFDVDPDLEPSVYIDEKDKQLTELFAANVEEKNPMFWIDLDNAVNQLFSQIPEILLESKGLQLVSSTNSSILINSTKTTDDIDNLPLKLFHDRKKEVETLAIASQRDLVEKYSGTDFYYLSTGSTVTDFVSGLLYEATNPSANFLNRYWSSHAVVSNTLNLKSEKDIGLFFTPDKHGILNYHSINFHYELNPDILVPDAIYVFPDPDIYATGRGNTKVDQSPVYRHYDDVSKLKATRLSPVQEGDIVNDQKLQKFFPYQSREESLGTYAGGISRSTDDFDFWTGEDKDIWSHSDVYPILPLQSPPFETRIQDLLVTDSIVYEWKTDIYGNDYALLKDSKPLRKTAEQISGNLTTAATQDSTASVNNSLYNPVTGSFGDPETAYYNYQLSDRTTTFTSRTDTITAAKTPYDRQNSISGKLFFRNVYSTEIDPASSSLSGIFVKYSNDANITNEIHNQVKNFDIIKDVIILETTNFLILERFTYDLKTTAFTSTLPRKVIMSLSGANTSLEKFANIYYDEQSDDIYMSKTVLHPFISGSNYKIIYPDIDKFNIPTRSLESVFSLRTLLGGVSADNINEHDNTYRFLSGQGFDVANITSILLSLSSDYINIESIDKPFMSINDNENTLTLNYFGHDPNCNVYLHNQYYDISDRARTRVKQIDFFRPNQDVFNYNIDSYFGHRGTGAPVLSSYVEGPLDRGTSRDQMRISYTSRSSQIAIPGEDEPFDMAFNSSLSGRDNTADKVFDTVNNTVRLGAGLSASFADEIQPSTDIATHSHNASYILYNSPLSGAHDDIAVCFDFALYTLSTGNSGYAQINHIGT